MKHASETFTRHDAMTMTPDEIQDFWIRRQRWLRDQSESHFTVLRNSDREGAIIATID